MEDRFTEDQLDTVKVIIERLQETADDLEENFKQGDPDDLESAIDEAQCLLLFAGKVLKEMI